MDTYLDRRLDEARAFLFDLDGVLTPTAEIHKRAWTRLFTRFLAHHPSARPYTDEDYYRLVDGRRRYDGVRAVLDSRGIHLPPGQATDSGSLTSVCGLGNLKDGLFLDELRARPIDPYPGSLRLVQALAQAGLPMAVVSASNNAHQVLESAGLVEFFPVIVDGHQAQAEGLAGKPAPDTYLAAARQLGADPARTAVVEDALGGVSAGRAGGFSPVIGVDRGAGGPALIAHGATLVVDDLDQLLLDPPRTELPAEGPGPIVGRENPPLSDQLPAGWPTPTVGAEDGQSSDEED